MCLHWALDTVENKADMVELNAPLSTLSNLCSCLSYYCHLCITTVSSTKAVSTLRIGLLFYSSSDPYYGAHASKIFAGFINSQRIPQTFLYQGHTSCWLYNCEPIDTVPALLGPTERLIE